MLSALKQQSRVQPDHVTSGLKRAHESNHTQDLLELSSIHALIHRERCDGGKVLRGCHPVQPRRCGPLLEESLVVLSCKCTRLKIPAAVAAA